MMIEIKIAIISFVWCEILTSDGMLFSVFKKLPDFLTCHYCLCGQLALIYNVIHFSDVFSCIYSVFLSIILVHVLLLTDNFLNDSTY